MTHTRRAGYAVLGILMGAACGSAYAADPLGFYVGAGIGHSQVRNDVQFVGASGAPILGPLGLSEGATGWKAILGIRPLSIIGAEAEYLDFGSASGSASIPATVTTGGLNATGDSHPKAPAIFAMGYLPIPLPYLDIFAKAGVAELKSSVNASAQATCPIGLPCIPILIPPYSAGSSSTRFAYGAGLQVKLASLAVRAEYQRIHSSSGDPDLLSLALTWSPL
ncbi:MAG: porin family protein [Gammaproteobacteria bacterium]|nr:MAG: porin family protein [Gammaproteobacteria bacterium]TLY66052.1 MAG: porin family protein [Gammaproteobacteria bacterium]TLY86371.1 MAG: porin family protein [Gammaproteobacteria bacterium]